jgi:hypothetical protein
MDEHNTQNEPYEAPIVEDIDVAEGPASVASGVPSQLPS